MESNLVPDVLAVRVLSERVKPQIKYSKFLAINRTFLIIKNCIQTDYQKSLKSYTVKEKASSAHGNRSEPTMSEAAQWWARSADKHDSV